MVLKTEDGGFRVGDEVQWVRVREHSKGAEMWQCRGKILEFAGSSAIVKKTTGKRQKVRVSLSCLRPAHEPGQLTEMVMGKINEKEGT